MGNTICFIKSELQNIDSQPFDTVSINNQFNNQLDELGSDIIKTKDLNKPQFSDRKVFNNIELNKNVLLNSNINNFENDKLLKIGESVNNSFLFEKITQFEQDLNILSSHIELDLDFDGLSSSEINELMDKVISLRDNKIFLENNIQELKSLNEKINLENGILINNNKQLKGDIDEFSKKLKMNEEENNYLKVENKNLSDKIFEIESSLSQAKDLYEEKNSQIKNSISQIDELRNLIEEKENLIVEIDSLKKDNNELANNIIQLKKIIKKFKKDLQECEREKSILSKEKSVETSEGFNDSQTNENNETSSKNSHNLIEESMQKNIPNYEIKDFVSNNRKISNISKYSAKINELENFFCHLKVILSTNDEHLVLKNKSVELVLEQRNFFIDLLNSIFESFDHSTRQLNNCNDMKIHDAKITDNVIVEKLKSNSSSNIQILTESLDHEITDLNNKLKEKDNYISNLEYEIKNLKFKTEFIQEEIKVLRENNEVNDLKFQNEILTKLVQNQKLLTTKLEIDSRQTNDVYEKIIFSQKQLISKLDKCFNQIFHSLIDSFENLDPNQTGSKFQEIELDSRNLIKIMNNLKETDLEIEAKSTNKDDNLQEIENFKQYNSSGLLIMVKKCDAATQCNINDRKDDQTGSIRLSTDFNEINNLQDLITNYMNLIKNYKSLLAKLDAVNVDNYELRLANSYLNDKFIKLEKPNSNVQISTEVNQCRASDLSENEKIHNLKSAYNHLYLLYQQYKNDSIKSYNKLHNAYIFLIDSSKKDS